MGNTGTVAAGVISGPTREADVELIDLTRIARRRRWRRVAQLGWGLAAAEAAGIVVAVAVLALLSSPGSLDPGRRPYAAGALAVMIVLAVTGGWLAARIGRAEPSLIAFCVFIAPIPSLLFVWLGALMVAASVLGSIGDPLTGTTIVGPPDVLARILFVLWGCTSIAVGATLLPASLSTLRSVRERAHLKTGSTDAEIAALVFPWRRPRDYVLPEGVGFPVLGLVFYLLVACVVVALELVKRLSLPLELVLGTAIAVVTVIETRLFLKSSTLTIWSALAADERPPVLYLRSFSTDHDHVWRLSQPSFMEMYTFRQRFAEFLARVICTAGPVIAISEPGERGETIGLAQQHFGDEEWRARALELMDRAGLIVLVAGRKAGVRWEVEQLLANDHLGKTVLLLPRRHGTDHLEAWFTLCDAFEATGTCLPEEVDASTVAVLGSSEGRMKALSVKRADAPRNYETAVRAALRLVMRGETTMGLTHPA